MFTSNPMTYRYNRTKPEGGTEEVVVTLYSGVLPLDRLQVDSRYQRGVTTLVNTISTAFSWAAFGVVWAAERADGSLWIVDGLQRSTGARKFGLTEVPAVVFRSYGQPGMTEVEMESDVFRMMNAWRRPVTTPEIFRAALEGKIPYAVSINRTVLEYGFEIDLAKKVKTTQWPRIQAIGALESIYAAGAIPALEKVLRTVGTCWDGQGESLTMPFLKGVHMFWAHHSDDFTEDEVHARFSRHEVAKILHEALKDKLAQQKQLVKIPLQKAVYHELRKIGPKKRAKQEAS